MAKRMEIEKAFGLADLEELGLEELERMVVGYKAFLSKKEWFVEVTGGSVGKPRRFVFAVMPPTPGQAGLRA